MPNWRMLQRVVASFGRAPRAYRRLLASLSWGPSEGPENKWLDRKADEYMGAAHRDAKRARFADHFESVRQ